MLDGLSGKFAQRSPEWEDDPEIAVEQPWRQWPEFTAAPLFRRFCRSVGWKGQKYTGSQEHTHSFPAISAWIAAYARRQMADVMSQLPARSVLYIGTDSLLLTTPGFVALHDAGRVHCVDLGKFRLQAQELSATIWGARRYRLGDKLAVSGLSRKAVPIGEGTWRQEQWERLWPILLSDQKDAVAVKERTFTVSADYTKGHVGPEGWTGPLVFPEDREVLEERSRQGRGRSIPDRPPPAGAAS
jgi:hypothetical protein